jgi:hypothetical protein
VKLYDRSSEQISNGLKLMDKLLAKDVAKGKIQEGDARQARERVSVVDQAVGVRSLRDVDMVIEVRTQADLFLLLSSLSILSRLSRRTLNSSNAYSLNWQPRRGPTPSWQRIRPLFLSPKLQPLPYLRANLLRRLWARAVRDVLLVSFTSLQLASRYNCNWVRASLFQPCPCYGELSSRPTTSHAH